jgi:hypothetical protein
MEQLYRQCWLWPLSMGQGNWKWSAGVVLILAHLDGPTSITALSESAVRRTPPRQAYQ